MSTTPHVLVLLMASLYHGVAASLAEAPLAVFPIPAIVSVILFAFPMPLAPMALLIVALFMPRRTLKQRGHGAVGAGPSGIGARASSPHL